MKVSQLKLLVLAVGLTAAGPALGYNLTVASKATTFGGAGAIVDVDTAAATPRLDCAVTSPVNCLGAATATEVALSAVPGAGSVFVKWDNCPDARTTYNAVAGNFCVIPGTSADRKVYAWFKPTAYSVTVKPGVGGSITVAANSACTDTVNGCTYPLAANATVALTATPDAGKMFKAWAGCSSATASCSLTVTGPKTVSASFFTGTEYNVLVSVHGDAPAGSITGTGVTCPGDCAGSVAAGGNLDLTAAGTGFQAWYGCSSVAGNVCTLSTVNANQYVVASYATTSCGACHGKPPATHGPNAGAFLDNCANCHTGFTKDSAPVGHNDGVVTVNTAQVPAAAPAGDGFNVTILGATLAADAKPVVKIRVLDNQGQPVDMAAFYSATAPQYRAGWTTTGTSVQPAIAIEGVRGSPDYLLEGAITPTLVSTTASTTITPVAADWAPVTDEAGNWNVTLNAYMRSATVGSGRPDQIVHAFDAAKTYRIQLIGGRYGGAARNVVYASNPYLDVVPNGVTAKTSYEIVNDAACRKCHGETFKLDFHSNRRIGALTCKVCHYDGRQAAQANRDMGYQNFIHRLHNGLDMYSGTGPYTPRFGWDEIKMAPSHKLYFEGSNSATASGTPALAVIDPELTVDCVTCHTGADANVAFTKPSKKACGSCHDINWTTGQRYGAGLGDTGPIVADGFHGYPNPSDAGCVGCHPETGTITAAIRPVRKVHGKFFEPAHDVDFTALAGFPANGHDFRVTLVDVTADATGKPTFTVDVSLDGAPFDIKASLTATLGGSLDASGGRVATCAFQVAGPTKDFTTPATGGTAVGCGTSASTWTAVAGTPGRFTFSSGTFFAGKADGYYTAAFEIMWQRVTQASNGDYVRKPFSADPNFLTAKKTGTVVKVTDPVELAMNDRRAVVSFDKCNACHQDLGFHSNRGRKGPDYCATCHNPKLDNGTRARYPVADARAASTFDPSFSSSLVYIPESVSMNVFIHRIHMGSKLPSVSLSDPDYPTAVPATASKWVQKQGEIKYGATRSAFVGFTADTEPEFADLSHYTQPSPMIRCDQCHISSGATKTWAMYEGAGLAPVERTLRVCTPTTPSWSGGVEWCNNTSNNGPAVYTKPGTATPATIVTPPLKATCTSCHDSAATDAHADAFTQFPMSRNAVEFCATCHGAGKAFDAETVHRPLP